MKARLVVPLLLGLAGVVHASDNLVEVTLEDTPDQQQSQQPAFRRWRFQPQPRPAIQDSDSQGAQWQFKFIAASDKRLGTTADSAAINALVPSTTSATVRWVSRSVVAVAAGCSSSPSSREPPHCLYVLEKRRSKWKITHHYFYRGISTF
jgi:hypothetical protein